MSDRYIPDNEPRDILLSLEELALRKLSNAPTFRKAADEITRLREENDKMKYFLRHNVFAEKQFGVYFVCGEGGDKDRNGIPEQIYVCPAYGSDIIYRYKRMDSSAPQW